MFLVHKVFSAPQSPASPHLTWSPEDHFGPEETCPLMFFAKLQQLLTAHLSTQLRTWMHLVSFSSQHETLAGRWRSGWPVRNVGWVCPVGGRVFGARSSHETVPIGLHCLKEENVRLLERGVRQEIEAPPLWVRVDKDTAGPQGLIKGAHSRGRMQSSSFCR